MANCVFCQIIDGKIPSTPVYQDDSCIVIPDIHPASPVHLLVIPKLHVADFMDADVALVGKLMAVVKTIIKEQKIKNYRLVNNGGGAAYIDHLHIHILGQVDKARGL